MTQQITITPAMRLVAWVQETHSAKVAVSVNFYGNHVHLYVYDTTGERPESVIELHCHEWFSHEKCNEWIFQANQEIEQYIAAQEAAMRMVLEVGMLAEVDDEIAEAKLDLAENLETLLAEKGWQKLTITEITQRLNHDLSNCRLIGSKSLRNWRLGKTLPTYSMLLALADRIDCHPTDLLTTKQQGLLRVTKDKK